MYVFVLKAYTVAYMLYGSVKQRCSTHLMLHQWTGLASQNGLKSRAHRHTRARGPLTTETAKPLPPSQDQQPSCRLPCSLSCQDCAEIPGSRAVHHRGVVILPTLLQLVQCRNQYHRNAERISTVLFTSARQRRKTQTTHSLFELLHTTLVVFYAKHLRRNVAAGAR
jgi:hypothetical protein